MYENPSIRQFVAIAFQKLQCQSQAGYLKKLGISCTSRKFCAQNTQQNYTNIGKIDPKKRHRELKKTDTKIQ